MQTARPVTKPTKQRKMLFQAPDHVRHKLFAAPLSPELKTSHKVNTLPVRSGDAVRIMRGDHKGFEGKITRIDREKYRIYVEGLSREKVDGTTVFVPIHPSKVMITRLNLDDKWRKKVLERKKTHEKVKKAVRKPPKEVVEVKEEVAEEKIAVEEKVPEKKPKRKAVKRQRAKKTEEKVEKTKEEKPKKTRAKGKKKAVKKKTEGES